jgi:hypothetical protein
MQTNIINFSYESNGNISNIIFKDTIITFKYNELNQLSNIIIELNKTIKSYFYYYIKNKLSLIMNNNVLNSYVFKYLDHEYYESDD